MTTIRLLTINTGSSSLRAGLYRFDPEERPELAAEADRIGLSGGRLRVVDASGATLLDREERLPNHDTAVRAVLTWLRSHGADRAIGGIGGIGHRVVHGARYREPQVVSDELLEALRQLLPVDPDHLPQALEAIRLTSEAYPTAVQVACFDTAFHRDMPLVARAYPLPRELADAGVTRYGFHGLSCEFIMRELVAEDPAAAAGRVVIAHLGNGASMAAVRGGVSVETTMGFSPTGGLMMARRSGDLDPGVLLYLLRSRDLSPSDLSELLNQRSGLLGVSGTSSDMRDLLDREAADPHAAEAIALFCYQARKFLGALAAVLGGLDTLVFTAGIGEHAPLVRERICAGLEFLGIQLDPDRNAASAPIVSRDGARAVVRVMRTDEDLMIARHTHRLLAAHRGGSHVSV